MYGFHCEIQELHRDQEALLAKKTHYFVINKDQACFFYSVTLLLMRPYCICSFAAIKGEGGVHDEISLVQFHKSWYMVLKFEMYFLKVQDLRLNS